MLRQCHNLPKLRNALLHLHRATTPTTILNRSIRSKTTDTKKTPPKRATTPPPRPLYHGLLSTTRSLLLNPLTTRTLTLFLTAHILFTYFYTLEACTGISMLPTIASYGDWVLISKYYRRGRGVEVGDVVSFRHPVEEGVEAVKRVVGLGGDFVVVGTPGREGKCLQLPEGHCWVVGDNLAHSYDSRLFGPLPIALVKGKVVAVWKPWTTWRRMENGLRDAEDDDVD